MVSNDAEGEAPMVAVVGLAGQFLDLGDQRTDQVGVVVAVDALYYRGDTLQAHTGIDAGTGQRCQYAVFIPLILHEHQIPDLQPAVAVADA